MGDTTESFDPTRSSLRPTVEIANIVTVKEIPIDNQRDSNTLYVTPFEVAKRDQVLGYFLDVWSSLEQSLILLLIRILKIDYGTAAAIFFNANGPHQYRSLFDALAEVRCTAADASKLASLMERLKRVATKRNKIVHGSWIPELAVGVDELDRPIVASVTWKRVASTQSAATREKVAKDPSQRNSLWFLVEDLVQTAEVVSALRADISIYTEQLEPLSPKPW